MVRRTRPRLPNSYGMTEQTALLYLSDSKRGEARHQFVERDVLAAGDEVDAHRCCSFQDRFGSANSRVYGSQLQPLPL
jgi:hypothetical protein